MSKYSLFLINILIVFIYSCDGIHNNSEEYSEKDLDSMLVQSLSYANDLDFEKALSSFQEIEQISKENNLIHYQILALINIGRVYYKFNEKEQALKIYLEALNLADENKDIELLISIYNNIGILYSNNKVFPEAENYFKRALQLSQELNISHKEIINYINIASIKEEQDQLDSALYFNEIALKKASENKINDFNSSIYNNIGDLFFKKSNYEKAKKYYNLALNTEIDWGQVSKIGKADLSYIGLYEFNIGKCFVELRFLDSAEYHFQNALLYFKKIKDVELISKCYYWLAKKEELKQHSAISQEYYENSLTWKDSLLFEKKDQWAKDVQLKYEFGKIEKEKEFLKERNKINKKIISIIITSSILIIILILSILKSRTKNLKQRNEILNKENKLAELEKTQNEMEKKKLEEEIINRQRLNSIEIEHKNNELVSNTVHLMNKNEILKSLLKIIEQIETKDTAKNKSLLEEMQNSIKNNINQDKSWQDFKLHFDKVHESFSKSLNKKHPSLTQSEFRLCAYLLIGLNPKEIAFISNISPESVRKRKQRLREKLNLDIKLDIADYLKSL